MQGLDDTMLPSPTFSTLVLSVNERVAVLEFSRPDKLNALSRQLLTELILACSWLIAQQDIRVVIVRGKGKSFSAGFDLADFANVDPAITPRESADLGRRATDALTDVPQITIASIHGHCIGGGVVLAAACDLRIASTNTRFSIPEVDLGIPLAWGGIPRLVREIGPAATKELVLTCREFDAHEAKNLSLVNTVVEPDRLVRHVEELAQSIANKSLIAVRSTKAMVNAVTEEMIGTARSISDADTLVVASADPESRAAGANYLSKRRRTQ